jgi:hypothetical protein
VDPDPQRSASKIYKLDPDPHQFAYIKPKCMASEYILALFQEFEPFV